MAYKIDLNKRMDKTKEKLSKCFMHVSIRNQMIKASNYSLKEEEILITMKKQGSTNAEIANMCNRSYWSVADKIRRLRKEGKI